MYRMQANEEEDLSKLIEDEENAASSGVDNDVKEDDEDSDEDDEDDEDNEDDELEEKA